jgi:DNA polymerase I
MTDLYITTTETLYPGETKYEEVVVRLYGRTREGESLTVTVRGFDPYFLAPAADTDKVPPADYKDLRGYEKVETDPLSERFDENPEALVKVNCRYPHSVAELRKQFDKTWGADTIFTERFRIDHDVKTGIRVPDDQFTNGEAVISKDDVEPVAVEDVTPRVLTLDIETDDRDDGFPAPGDARILSIAIHDSYTDEYGCFLDLDGQGKAEFFDISLVQKAKLEAGDLSLSDVGLTGPDSLRCEDSEAQMLTAFAETVQSLDPDIICGWNSGDSSVDGFDVPHIIERMKNVGATAGRLSRERGVEVEQKGDDHYAEIAGRALYDLMDGWADTKFTQPRSKKLDDVAQLALDDAKIEHEDQGYYEMYRDDPVKFVNYNVKDTRLTVDINNEENILSFKKRLKDIVGVDWRRTHQNNEFIEMAVRRKCAENGVAMITAYDNEYVGGDTDEINYEGAYVFSPFNGLHKNVVGIDLESLYPRTQQMLNASPDTRIEKSEARKECIPFVEAENGQTFRDDVDGIIRELITDYMQLKAKFKEERNEADPGTEEREKLAEVYNVTKTIVNSFYGYGGWNRSPLYNPHDAAAVTLTGQAVIKATAEYVNEETPGEVAYGDTDSVYCSWPDNWGQVRTLEYVDGVCDYLNDELYPTLCEEYGIEPEDNRWNMELEKRGDMFMSGQKKRYSMRTVWTEGMQFNEVIV